MPSFSEAPKFPGDWEDGVTAAFCVNAKYSKSVGAPWLLFFYARRNEPLRRLSAAPTRRFHRVFLGKRAQLEARRRLGKGLLTVGSRSTAALSYPNCWECWRKTQVGLIGPVLR